MRSFISLVFIIPTLLLATAACHSPMKVANADAGKVSVCRLCYTKIEEVRMPSGQGRPDQVVTRRTHACEECKSEASIYTADDGTLMIRCAKCAPEGVACDRCTPVKK